MGMDRGLDAADELVDEGELFDDLGGDDFRDEIFKAHRAVDFTLKKMPSCW